MAVFLADRIPTAGKLWWFGIGLSAALAARALAPVAPAAISERTLGCPKSSQKPARFLGIGQDLGDYSDVMGKTATETFRKIVGADWTIAPAGSADVRSGFHISPRLLRIDTRVQHDPKLDNNAEAMIVTCRVALDVATYPHLITIATVESSARVTAASTTDHDELALAHFACVTSAVEDAVQQAAPALLD